ncbi:extracellular triacylglycerol lipase precursor [Sistotremastrum suecicum HHB10207 ss-3]|uniref:Carboxylic ester hydrolase n=1 Tax=Sistotremastrum suecicum HHB10207 ss-3 TaxID=1314776 RepID=A0A166G0A5_9AGAM|nr:extracellular triacylglycerol lipase precursor [Sistotremastrum suecicum HHB10207 ss-3]
MPGVHGEFFGGIPFAKPPIGELRFEPPVLETTLQGGILNASEFGVPCIQIPSASGMSEDCLTVNVFRPQGLTSKSRLPVMVWIYGGGFIAGSASIYNGSLIVQQSITRGTPIIFVNLNYRLGTLGFPTGSEAQSKGALNLGLKDQLTALEWVHTNIGAFGGDNSRVTIFGESAGAISIADLFLNSKLERFVRAAILESGSPATTSLFTSESGTSLWQTFARAVPACASANLNNTFGCLKSASVADIISATSTASKSSTQDFAFVPVIDGEGGMIPDLPSVLQSRGLVSRIPFIAGTNLDEGTLFTDQTVNSSAGVENGLLETQMPSTFPLPILQSAVARILDLYPDDPSLGSPFSTGNETFGLSSQYKRAAAINGDMNFQALRRAWIQSATSHGVGVYGYLFTDPQPNSGALGVSHSKEIVYVFGVQALTGDPAVALLSVQMMDYWISFAVSLNPNDGKGSKRPFWSPYTSTNQEIIQLNSANLTMIPDNYRKEQISFINSEPLLFHH